MPHIFGSGFVPNVFLRPYFAFPWTQTIWAAGGGGDELEPKRGSGWVAEEVLMFKNWDWAHNSFSSPQMIHTYLSTCVLPQSRELFLPKPCQITWRFEKQLSSSSTRGFLPTSLNTLRVTSIPQGGSQLTFIATSKSTHIWSTRQAVYRCYHKRHFEL